MTVRWFRAVCWLGIALALVLLGIGLRPSFGAEATILQAGGKYRGPIIACVTQADAEHLRDMLAAGKIEDARAYLMARGNTCGADQDAEFTAVEPVGPVKADAKGRGWHLVRVTEEGNDLFLVTTSEFGPKGSPT